MLQYVQRNLFDFDAAAAPSCRAWRRGWQVSAGRPGLHDHPAAGCGLGGRPPGDLARTPSSRSGRSSIRRSPPRLQAALRGARVGRSARRAAVPGALQEALRVPDDGVRPAAPARAPVRGPGLPARRQGEPRAPLQRPVPRGRRGRRSESIELERNPRYPGPPRPLRPDRLPDRPGQHDGLPAARRRASSTRTRSTRRSRTRAPRGSGVCRLLPARRVLQPRLQLRRAQQPLAALRRRARRGAR